MDAMKQVGNVSKPRDAHVLQLRLLWPFLILLALFVLFFEFIADVGGSAGPLQSPPEHPTPSASPTPRAERSWDMTVPMRNVGRMPTDRLPPGTLVGRLKLEHQVPVVVSDEGPCRVVSVPGVLGTSSRADLQSPR